MYANDISIIDNSSKSELGFKNKLKKKTDLFAKKPSSLKFDMNFMQLNINESGDLCSSITDCDDSLS